jgi:hypothetical protein
VIKDFFFLLFSILLIAPDVMAQTTDPCSKISVESPEKVDLGVTVVFLAQPFVLGEVKYKWTVSAGTISSGQDTSSIIVDTTATGGQSIAATVEVAGRDWKCRVRSKRVEINSPLTEGVMPFDTYSDIRFEDEKARLDNFAIQVLNSPDERGAIMVFAGNPTYRGEAQYRLQRAKDYLVKVRRIDPARLVLTDGGYKPEVTTILYLIYKNEHVPPPDPYLAVPLSEVRFTKRPPSKLKRSVKPKP